MMRLLITITLILLANFKMMAVDLTTEEIKWLEDHKYIRYAPSPNYPPVEFFNEKGEFSGLTSDFITIIEDELGIEFDIVEFDTWSDVVTATKNREVDLWGCAAKNEERLEYMSFPEPYIFFPSVIVTSDSDKREYSLDNLQDKNVVVVNSYATHRFMIENYPDYNYIIVPDIPTGLSFVSIEPGDVMIVTNAAASYYAEKNGITNLRVARIIDDDSLDLNLGFAVRNDWPELVGMLQKTLDSIPNEKKQEIFRKWISLRGNHSLLTRRELMIIAAVVFIILATVIFMWNISLKAQVKRKTRELENANKEISLIFKNAPIVILYVVDRKIKNCSPTVYDFTGYDVENILGKTPDHLFLAEKDYENIRLAYDGVLKDGKIYTSEVPIRKKDNTVIWCTVIGQAVNADDPDKGIIWLVNDITAKKELEMTLVKQATTDPLTGLCNRRSFDDMATMYLQRSIRNERSITLLMLDIDHFKDVNDTFGHEAGDKVLVAFSRSISSIVREYDIIARIGGEEFVVMMPETDVGIAIIIAERIRSQIEELKIALAQTEISVTVSIGVSTYSKVNQDITLEEFLSQADKALYYAKNHGRNQVKIYSGNDKQST